MKELLKHIIFDQREKDISQMIERDIDISLVNSPEVLVISGIRRCGKSVLLQQIRSQQTEQDYYMNFDDERLINFKVDDFQTLYEAFIELFGEQKTFYFDEIQNIPGWERFVRRLHDSGCKVFVTGSNANMLSRELGTHLTGRYCQIELYPFSFPEFLKIKEVYPQQKDFYTTTGKSMLKRYFDEYVKTGGFPRYIKDPNTNYLSTLYENIIYKDVVTRNKLNGERELLEMVYYLASNATKRFSYTSLAKTIGIKHTETVKNYLEYLENTYLLFQVMKFDWSVKKQMNNQKKVYFIDNAIIGKVGFNATDNIGQLLENLVFLEIKRQGKDVYYHDDRIECDFIMRENGHIVSACQVTRSMKDEKTRQREINGLVSALNAYNLTEGIVLTDDETEEITIDNKKIHIISIWRWLLKDSVTIPLT